MTRQLFILLLSSILAFACQQDTPRNYDFAVQGIDVSHYQSVIDWSLVAAQGFQFAFVKASEGAFFYDTLFEKNWQALEKAGIKKGAYHFFRPNVNPYIQANNFTNQVTLKAGDLPPVLDIETYEFLSPEELRSNLNIWLTEVETFYGVRPILYTNINFYNRYLAGHFSDHPLWIARYSKKDPTLACGSPWQFWQYGNRGKVIGIKGHVDFNVFQGTMADLEELTFKSNEPVRSVEFLDPTERSFSSNFPEDSIIP